MDKSIVTKIIYLFIIVAFIAISLQVIPYHEFWADEVQAFLIARDADWSEILTKTPYREGQPVLWHIVLKICVSLFGAEINISYISVAVMSLAITLIVFKYDIPLIYKILIPFGYYFMYQYNIVARNYCLAYLGLVLIGLSYKNRHQKLWPYILSLAFLAETTSLCVPIVAILSCFYLYEICFQYRADYKKYIFPLSFLILVGLSILWQILPINSNSYNLRNLDLQPEDFLAEVFFIGGNQYLDWFFVIFFSIIFLYYIFSPQTPLLIKQNKKSIYQFIICNFIFLFFLFLTLPGIHHQGLVFGMFLLSYYLFFPVKNAHKHYFFISILALQIYWSYCAIKYDINNDVVPYKQVVEIVKKNNLLESSINIMGYQTLPVQLLLPQGNIRKNTYYVWDKDDIMCDEDVLKQRFSSADVIILEPDLRKLYKRKDILDEAQYRIIPLKSNTPHKDTEGFAQDIDILIKRKD